MRLQSILVMSFALAALVLNACGDDNKSNKTEQNQKCQYTVKCNDTGTELLTCKDGVVTSKLCTCNNNACESSGDTNCNYEGSKCNAEGTALLTCNGGVETSKPCSCKNNACESNGRDCNYEGSKCNNEGTALLTCTNGSETSKTCECKDNACQTHQTNNDCDYTGSKCNTEGTALLTCNAGVESSNPCECVNNECVEHDIQCDFEGKKCNSDRTALVTCSDWTIVESKTCTCRDNKCVVTCVTGSAPSCSDDFRSRIYCDNDHTIKTEECGNDKVCNNGICESASSHGSCEFEAQCTSDLSGIRRCQDGNTTFTPCENRFSCDIPEDTNTPTCVSAMTTSTICKEAIFRPYCDTSTNTAYTCESNELVETPCGTGTCTDGVCSHTGTHEIHINDTCTYGVFREQCVGQTAVECDSTGHVVALPTGDCASKDQICGVITGSSGLPSAECFDECHADDLGHTRDTCLPISGKFHVGHYECIDIGNGKYGYDLADFENTPCDLGCTAGHCMDYTELFPQYGQECAPATDNERCLTTSTAAICDVNNSGSEGSFIWQLEMCSTNEICFANSETPNQAGCYEQCNAGDQPRFTCGPNDWGYFSQKFECKPAGSGYAYLETDIDICPSNKGCAEDGQCKK